MGKIALLIAIGLFIFFNIDQINGHSIEIEKGCGKVKNIQPPIFDLEELNQSDQEHLNKRVLFSLNNKPYSFNLKNDENLLIYYYMFEMLHEAKQYNTFVDVEYKLEEGENRIVSMAFCRKNEGQNCLIE